MIFIFCYLNNIDNFNEMEPAFR